MLSCLVFQVGYYINYFQMTLSLHSVVVSGNEVSGASSSGTWMASGAIVEKRKSEGKKIGRGKYYFIFSIL